MVEVREGQSQAYTNTNDYKDGQTDREVGTRVIMWVRRRQAGRQIDMSACFYSPQEAGAAGLGTGPVFN